MMLFFIGVLTGMGLLILLLYGYFEWISPAAKAHKRKMQALKRIIAILEEPIISSKD